MIRINLLPQKREARRDSGQGWLIATMLVVAAEVVVLGLFHQFKLQELDKQKQINSELNNQIAQINTTVQNHAEVKKKLEVLRAREDAINKLQSARSGPTAVLLELSRILTAGRGPTISAEELMQKKKDNPQDVHNASWDARRLWVLSFKENQRVVNLEGFAHDGEDVSELARRLSLSKYFQDVVLLPASQQVDGESKLNVVRFQLQTKARY
ncbi:MAG TPA: PilN domain-containing protein [Polyangiaceae bacterium]|nr:MAG: Fimbrial assembly protein (PilN) [Deltaproteobacteria bacterium ADurb.Bin207]HNS98545.1 PilN domain-containing protein [Polyangiaceae bacterium]HNZ24873.1 PilN domain-containing protein [Polyangiaceae bacterium]HOD24595.1 PilN domain-containing protein [Polyangiaceae bacterium]HOE50216.1 PilN domain-containing protein [Polyangiaceae bacterium]